MKKLFSAKRYNSSSELRAIQKPTVRLRSIDDCRVEERRSSSPRACLAFSALSIWNWIGGIINGHRQVDSFGSSQFTVAGGRRTSETAVAPSTLFEKKHELERGDYEDENQCQFSSLYSHVQCQCHCCARR